MQGPANLHLANPASAQSGKKEKKISPSLIQGDVVVYG